MTVVDSLEAMRQVTRPVVLAIGMFDGLHLGHQAVIRQAVERAQALQGEAWVLTLDPHPLKILKPMQAPPLLTSTRHKLRLIEPLGIQGCLVLPFTRERADEEPENFVSDLLECIPALNGIVVGENWTFGRQARGRPALLEELTSSRGISVIVVAPVACRQMPISSTRIRNAVFQGRLDEAAAMLGRPFSILGDVVPGRQFGRTMGFPTANVDPHNEVQPPPGVYAAYLLHRGRKILGAAFRPDPATGAPPPPHIVEIHLFDFNEDLYQQEVEVFFIRQLRQPRHFANEEQLRRQIALDIAGIHRFFIENPSFKPS
ncbi:MAG: riboflavin biosynthesis protein RibF [Lentisphaerae bacterium GWF2_57_35]|nr:MAG: riboflavin biosynthesis protein RibF [Lentisphaerae bacterium GWF2_57_35]